MWLFVALWLCCLSGNTNRTCFSNFRNIPWVMKRFLISLIFIFLTFVVYAQKRSAQRWFKGNLHTHSLWSDGDGYPEMIVDWYQARGYNFLALSDHNIFAQGEKW